LQPRFWLNGPEIGHFRLAENGPWGYIHAHPGRHR
jgi:hypothetical protein